MRTRSGYPVKVKRLPYRPGCVRISSIGKVQSSSIRKNRAVAAPVEAASAVVAETMRFEARERAFFIGAHQPGIPRDVGGENCSELAFDL
jgi:hypothetical protein